MLATEQARKVLKQMHTERKENVTKSSTKATVKSAQPIYIYYGCLLKFEIAKESPMRQTDIRIDGHGYIDSAVVADQESI